MEDSAGSFSLKKDDFDSSSGPDSRTENGALAFSTSGAKCVDLFTLAVRNIELKPLLDLFDQSFDEDPEMTFKILFNLRDISRPRKGQPARPGKGEKHIARILFAYIKIVYPDIYKELFPEIVDLGSWKDLLVISEIASRYHKINSVASLEMELFADQLLCDRQTLLEHGSKASISLASKWAPTEKSHFDHHPMFFSKMLAHKMGLSRGTYRKEISKLRQHLNILERNLATGHEELIEFGKLSSVAHRKSRILFQRETNAKGNTMEKRTELMKRYQEYLGGLKKGTEKINATGTQPHELVCHYLYGKEYDETIEQLWKKLMKTASENSMMQSTMAVVDVSGSMNGIPMSVSIALGIVVSLLTQGSFNRKLITFSEIPQWFDLKGESLKDMVNNLQHMKWGYNTNIMAVFDLILSHAKTYNLLPQQMVKTLFIFTDMQFDQATQANEKTVYEEVKAKYADAGYDVPYIIFWNLRSSTVMTLPVMNDAPGIALVSGFSEALISSILESGVVSPMEVLKYMMSKYTLPKTPLDVKPELFNFNKFQTAVEKSKIKPGNKKNEISNDKTDETNESYNSSEESLEDIPEFGFVSSQISEPSVSISLNWGDIASPWQQE